VPLDQSSKGIGRREPKMSKWRVLMHHRLVWDRAQVWPPASLVERSSHGRSPQQRQRSPPPGPAAMGGAATAPCAKCRPAGVPWWAARRRPATGRSMHKVEI
jgi:hypothetical protein